jgi:hypothetical protein
VQLSLCGPVFQVETGYLGGDVIQDNKQATSHEITSAF